MSELVFQFSTSHEFSSWIIREVCASPFSHVDAVLPDGSLYGASNSPEAPTLEGNPNGVAIRPGDYQLFKRRRRARIPVSDEQHDLFWSLARKELGKRFDDNAVSFKFYFNDEPFLRDWRYDEHWFCPELPAYLCEKISLWPYPLIVPKNRLSPHALLTWMWPLMSNRSTFWLFPLDLQPMPGEEVEFRNERLIETMFGETHA